MKPFLAVFILLSLLGCDRNKAERATLKPVLDGKISAMLDIERNLNEIDSRLSRSRSAMDNIRSELRQHNTEFERNKQELATYCLDNKAAVAAVLSTGGGLAVQLVDDVPEDFKSAGALAAMFGAGYCLFNFSECTDATAHLGYYGSQMSSFKNKANTCGEQLQKENAIAEAIERERQPVAAMLAQAKSDASAMQERYDSLACKGLLCW